MITRISKSFAIGGVVLAVMCCPHRAQAYAPTQEEILANRQRIKTFAKPCCTTIPEGDFVYYYNPTVGKWLQDPLSSERIEEIQDALAPYLKIPLTPEGFSSASPRNQSLDPTSYCAVWVRDCCWHYFGLQIIDPLAARTLMLSLLDFYSTDDQISRFLAIIENPKLSDPSYNPTARMDVPLIRFSSKTLTHHQVDGKNQQWNHIQFDSHGLFLLALSHALTKQIIRVEDLTSQRCKPLILFPAFFTETCYAEKKDAGPWEEVLLCNASTAGLVSSGINRFDEVCKASPSLCKKLENVLDQMQKASDSHFLITKILSARSFGNIRHLCGQGMKRVEKNLDLGGEAPDLDGGGINRQADVALLFLCLLEHTPYHGNPKRIKQILNITSGLIGPYGIYRYKRDAYQAAGYWTNYCVPSSFFGKPTAESVFITRFNKGYMPDKAHGDAQWFFDSNFAQVYYDLSLMECDVQRKKYYIRQGDKHLKRALGQMTGPSTYAANGEELEEWRLPESINSGPVAPSCICPLSWATSALIMALDRAKVAHQSSVRAISSHNNKITHFS